MGFRTKLGLRCKTLRKGCHLSNAEDEKSLELEIALQATVSVQTENFFRQLENKTAKSGLVNKSIAQKQMKSETIF